MEPEHKRKIEEIVGVMNCPKDFKCCESDFANVCKAKDIGIQSFLVCLEEDPQRCKFALSFGDSYLCQCPLRVYIAKKSER